MTHFDNIFKNVLLDYQNSVPEIEHLKCTGIDLAVHVPRQIQEKIFKAKHIYQVSLT